MTPIAVISASPMASALAVAAVRRGLRRPFSRASLPTALPAKGAPSTRSTPRPTMGARAMTATSAHSAEMPDELRGPLAVVDGREPRPCRDHGERQQHGSEDRAHAQRSHRQVDLVAHRRHRRDDRRAAGRHVRRDQRDHDADDDRDHDGPRREHERSRGQVGAERPEQHLADPARRAPRRSRRGPRRARPSTNASASTERRTCPRLAPTARSSASSRVRWATSIEKVLKMRKIATNSAMNANASRNVLMNWNVVSSRSAMSALRCCTGLGARILRHDCGDSRGERVLRDARVGPHRDARDLVVRLEQQRLGRGQVEDRQRRAVAARDAPRHQAGDHGLHGAARGIDAHRVADLHPGGVGRRLEQRDLPAADGGLAGGERERADRRVGHPRGAARRRTGTAHDLAVGPDHQRAVGRDDAVRRGDAVDGARPRRHQRAPAASAPASPPRAAPPCRCRVRPPAAGGDDDVGLRRLEERVERLLQRVGEDEGARDERDADHDGEQGEREPQLVLQQGTQSGAQHGDQALPPRTPSCVRAPSRPWARAISSTIRPSARNSTRSAYDAAPGSWVTITMVWPNSSTLRRRKPEHLGAGAGVEVAGGLVGEHDRGAAGERAGARDALLLAAGQLARPVAEPVAQADRVDHGVEPLLVGLAAGDVERERDVLERGQRRDQVERLEHEADGVAAQPGEGLVGQRRHLGVADPHLAAARSRRARRGSA